MGGNSGRKRPNKPRPNNNGGRSVALIGPTETAKGKVVYERLVRQPLLRKWYDTNWATVSNVAGVSTNNLAAISSVGSHIVIGAIAPGTDRINRIGRSVRLTGFELRAVFNAQQQNLLTSGSADNVFRIILYRLRAPDPVTSAGNITANIFPVGDPITAIADADDVAEIYFDRTVAARKTNVTAVPATSQWQALVHETVRLNVPVTFINTGAANIESNMVMLSVWSDQSTSNFPDGSASFRVFFEDT